MERVPPNQGSATLGAQGILIKLSAYKDSNQQLCDSITAVKL